MKLEGILPLSQIAKENIFSHKLSKESLDAPVESVMKQVDSLTARANYFPFDSTVGKINTEVKVAIKEPEVHNFITESACI